MNKKNIPFLLTPIVLTSSATAATVIFGANHDGYAGFTASTSTPATTPAPAWTLETEAVRFTNDPTGPASPPDSGQVNSSLLKGFTLDRSNGLSYSFQGVVDVLSTYAADNNRLGISLFASSDELSGIDAGLSLQVNLGAGNLVIRSGVNGGAVTTTALSGITAANLVGETLNYHAIINFIDTDIDVSFTLSAPDLSYSQTVTGTVAAVSHEGEFFGFGTRGRVRNGNPGFIYDAKSFSVNMIPEPSTPILISLFGVIGLVRRCR